MKKLDVAELIKAINRVAEEHFVNKLSNNIFATSQQHEISVTKLNFLITDYIRHSEWMKKVTDSSENKFWIAWNVLVCFIRDEIGMEYGKQDEDDLREAIGLWFEANLGDHHISLQPAAEFIDEMRGTCNRRPGSEFTDEQIKRIDEVHNAVFELCKVLTEDENLDWDMSYMGEIADYVCDILVSEGFRIRYPVHVYNGDGTEYVTDWHNDVKEIGEGKVL